MERFAKCRTPYFSKWGCSRVVVKWARRPKSLRAAIQVILAKAPKTHTFVF